MTAIWLSPGLPAGRGGVAAALGPGYEVVPDSSYPPADVVAVVSVYETELLRSLAARPDDIRLVLLTPPGYAVPGELTDDVAPDLVAVARDDADVASTVRGAFPAVAGAPVAGPGGTGWWAADAGTVPPPAVPPRRGGSRRLQGIAVAVVLVAVLGIAIALLTSGSSSSSAAGPAAGSGGEAAAAAPGGGTGGSPPTMSAAEKATLTACLKKNGVTLSGGNLPQRGTLTAKEQAALEKCLPARSGGGTGGRFPGGTGGTGGIPAVVPSTRPNGSAAAA